jgi:hypothetical protein
MINLTTSTTESDDEYFVFPVPEGAQDDDVLVVNIVTPEEAEAIFNAEDEDEEEEQ